MSPSALVVAGRESLHPKGHTRCHGFLERSDRPEAGTDWGADRTGAGAEDGPGETARGWVEIAPEAGTGTEGTGRLGAGEIG